MVTVDELSRLVLGIYRSAVSPGEWVPALNEVRCLVGATGGGLSIAEGSSREMKNTNVPAEAMASYGEHYQYLDYVLAAVETGPVGLVRSGSELVGLKADSEFDAEWMRPYEMDDGLFVKLTDGRRPSCLIMAAQKRSAPFATAERVRLVNALVPHLQTSLRTERHVRELVHGRDDLAPAIDAVRHGVVVIGPNRRVVHLNSTAERILLSRDGLQLRAGGVEAARAAVHAELGRTIDRALTCDGVDPWGGSFGCPRPSGLRPYVIHVLPVRQDADTAPRDRRAIVVIVDPESSSAPPAALYRRLWNLTAAEADIAARLAGGGEPREIADELSVSVATVRKHLQHLYAKTETHRQAELVRLLVTVDP